MTHQKNISGLLKLQRALVILIIFVFAAAIAADIFDRDAGTIFYNISIMTLILSAPTRLIWMSEYFRKGHSRLYQILSYIVIAIIILTILWKVLP
jgi:hypothetical protein